MYYIRACRNNVRNGDIQVLHTHIHTIIVVAAILFDVLDPWLYAYTIVCIHASMIVCIQAISRAAVYLCILYGNV
jgi:hypothetical protein